MTLINKYARIRRCKDHLSDAYGCNGLMVFVTGGLPVGHSTNVLGIEPIPGISKDGIHKCCLDFDDLEAYALTVKYNSEHPNGTT